MNRAGTGALLPVALLSGAGRPRLLLARGAR